MPSAATVAYAFARSSGVVCTTPRVNAPQSPDRVSAITRSAGLRSLMPSRRAMATARPGPICSSSHTKYVLTERPYPSHMVRYPFIHGGLSLTGHHMPPQPRLPPGHRVTSGEGARNPVDSGRPDSSAASMVDILKVEPVWYPSTPP